MEIAVTGLGVVSPLGNRIDAFWNALLEGRSGITSMTKLESQGFAYHMGGEAVLPADSPGDTDRATAFVVHAAREALAMADANAMDGHRQRTAVVLSTNFGGACCGESLLAHASGHGETSPRDVENFFFQSAADQLASLVQARGPRQVLSLSCASGTAAICHGADLVRLGHADRALVGGYDAISRLAWSGLSALRTMTKEACIRPFDLNRSGTLFSEGAGVLLLESSEIARRRGANVLALVAGGALGNNAHHMTAPAPRGAGSADVMRRALRQARMDVGAVDHINTHGTGTKYNDLTETQAIKDVFGEAAAGIPITSIKSMTGHLMGAAGAVEAIAAILTIHHRVIPPTINYETPDPECDLDLVANVPREATVNAVLSNSAGIGGCNAAVVLKRTGIGMGGRS